MIIKSGLAETKISRQKAPSFCGGDASNMIFLFGLILNILFPSFIQTSNSILLKKYTYFFGLGNVLNSLLKILETMKINQYFLFSFSIFIGLLINNNDSFGQHQSSIIFEETQIIQSIGTTFNSSNLNNGLYYVTANVIQEVITAPVLVNN